MHEDILSRLIEKPEKRNWDMAIIYTTGKQPNAIGNKTIIGIDKEHNTLFIQVPDYPHPFMQPAGPGAPQPTMMMDAFIDLQSITAIDYLKNNRIEKMVKKIIT